MKFFIDKDIISVTFMIMIQTVNERNDRCVTETLAEATGADSNITTSEESLITFKQREKTFRVL